MFVFYINEWTIYWERFFFITDVPINLLFIGQLFAFWPQNSIFINKSLLW